MINKLLFGGNAESLETVQIQGIVLGPVQAELASLNASCYPAGDGNFIDVSGPTQIIFSVTDGVTGYDVILVDGNMTSHPVIQFVMSYQQRNRV